LAFFIRTVPAIQLDAKREALHNAQHMKIGTAILRRKDEPCLRVTQATAFQKRDQRIWNRNDPLLAVLGLPPEFGIVLLRDREALFREAHIGPGGVDHFKVPRTGGEEEVDQVSFIRVGNLQQLPQFIL
jgi:hypothetical protein